MSTNNDNRLSISAAARHAGISRQHLYSLIADGKISKQLDSQDNPYIDRQELLRFTDGRLPKVKPPSTRQLSTDTSEQRQPTPDKQPEIDRLETTVRALQEELRAAKNRETWYQQQIENTQHLLQIEHKRNKSWFSRMFGSN